jgi:PAS domain S-box-containing protein
VDEDQQRWEAELFRLLVEKVEDYAIFIVDVQGNIRSWSKAGERLLGYAESEVVGRPFALLFTQEDVSKGEPEREMTTALQAGRGEDDRWHVRKDGTRFWCSGVMTPLRDESATLRGYAKIMRDLTQQKLHEENEEILRLLVDSVHDYAIFMLDADGRILTWNAGAERLTGYSADESVGQNVSRFAVPGAPDAALEAARKRGRFEFRSWQARKDGSRFIANVLITAVHGDDRRLRGFSNVIRDITEREQARLALEESNRRKDEFLAVLSHELRNPLAPIMNSVHFLRQRARADDDWKQAIAVIDRQARGLARLVDDLLDVSMITTGKTALRKDPVELGELLLRAIETTRPMIDDRGHEIALRVPSEAVWIDADAGRMEQVFVNLLGNAAKYTPHGGRIEVAAERQGEAVRIAVRDNGVGIPGEMLPRVFDMFTQGDQSLDRPEGGLGIGLTVVRHLVLLHQGTVEAHSAGPGRGSEFVVRLRVAAPSAPAAENEGLKGRALRVLVTDDNADAAQTLARLLAMYGHEVRVESSGPGALAALQTFVPDVILLDIGLPGLDGYEVARRIREQPRFKGVRLIALTGYGRDADRARAEEAGFDELIAKPADPVKLLQTLATL